MANKSKGGAAAPKTVEEASNALDELPKAIDLNLRTLRGDTRDLILGAFKTRPKPWKEMSELEQKQMAHDIDVFAKEVVDRAARIIAGEGATTVEGKLESYTVKDGMKLNITCPATPDNLHALTDQVGSFVTLVRKLGKDAGGERAPAKIDKDQGSLIPDDDNDLVSAAESVGSKAAKDFAEDNPGSAGDGPLPDPAAEADAALAGSTQPTADEE